ncbi:MAG: hypothetical protein ABIG30_03360 [Candidatus Aenigmatarchaeota archaeon]
MGFFSKVRSAFQDKPKSIEVKVLDVDKAVEFLNEKTRDKELEILQEKQAKLDELPKQLELLRKSFETLGGANVPEERAKGSELAKDSFVNKAMKLIDNIDDKKDIDNVKSLLNSINTITPRQALHMEFFFREQLKDIGGHVKGIHALINHIESLESTGLVKERKDIENIGHQLRSVKNDIENNDKKIQTLMTNKNEWITEKKQKLDLLSDISVNGIDSVKQELSELRKERDSMHQHIDSMLGPAERVLKKYIYQLNENNEPVSELLELYTKAPPHVTFMQDETNELETFLKNSINVGDMDQKQLDRIKDIISRMDELAATRKKISKTVAAVHAKEKELQDVWMPKQKEREKIKREIDDMDENISSIERQLVDVQQDTKLKEAKIPQLKDELSQLITKATGTDVEVN